MKKLLTLILTAATVLSCTATVFAESTAGGLTLSDASHLVLGRESGYIEKIDGTVTVARLAEEFVGGISVLASSGKAKGADDNVASDDVVSCDGDSLRALIYGDVDRNGKVNLSDLVAIMKHIAGREVDICLPAANVADTAEGKVNLEDAVKLLRSIAEWDDISLGDVRMVFENKPLAAEAEDSTLNLSFTSIMNKIGAHELRSTGEVSYKIKLARNEYQSCTALLWSDTARSGMSAELSPFVSEFGDAELEGELQWVVYQPSVSVFTVVNPWDVTENNKTVKTDDHPEVVLDMADTFELKANANQQFVITVHSKKDTPAGMYRSTLSFKDAEGNTVKSAYVYAYVWDFTLPDTPYSASLFCGGGTVECYEYMLENNLSDYNLPYKISDPAADAYMNDPRVTAFVIAGGGHWYGANMYGGVMDRTDEQTVEYYNKVASNPEWFKKGLFYYTDEPWGSGLINVKTTYERLTSLLGTTNVRNITPLANNNTYATEYEQNKGIDPVAYIEPYINVWCPQSFAYHLATEGGSWTSRRMLKTYGEYSDRARAFRERGDEIWWYVCCSPEVPYANYFNFYQGVINRVLSWQQYFNNVDGVLYYRMFGGAISKYEFDIGNGDGILMYKGSIWGRDGYASSWRLLQVRDGFDDFDYLRIAESLVGREAVMEVVSTVTSGMLKYTEDYRVLESAVDEIVDMILEAQK